MAGDNILDGNWGFDAVFEHRRGLGAQADELFDGGAGAAFGARFQQLAQGNQRQDDRGGFEVVGLADLVAEARDNAQKDDQTVDISGQRTHGHQHIHIGAAVAQGFKRAADVLAAEHDDHRRRHGSEDE